MKAKILIFLITVLIIPYNFFAQGVLISNSSGSPDASAMLEVFSTDKGVLIPRMTESQRTGITSPANGLMVYQTDGDAGFYIYYDNPQDPTKSGWSKLPIGPNGFYINFPSSANNDITLGANGYGIRSNGGQLEYKNEGDANWTQFPSPPPWGALTIWWYKPAGQQYIRPDNNSNIRIYDDGQTNGFYFDGGTNQYGVFVRSTSNTYYPTGAIVGWTDVAGQQTYGYLGYRGHLQFGINDIWGSAVWGEVPDTSSVAGFFRTYDNADYAAIVSYSDVWIPGFFYCDDNSDQYAPMGIYGQLNVNTTSASFIYEVAIKGLSLYTPSSGNPAYTTGLYGYGGGYQDAIGVRAIGSSSNTGYGVYAYGNTTNYAKSQLEYAGVGGILAGDLTGAYIYGNYFGLNVSGQRYGLYVNNLQINEAPIVQMIQNKDKKIATYVPVSENNDIILRGVGTLNSKTVFVKFNYELTEKADNKSPIIVTVTPVGQNISLYIKEISKKGFVVATDSELKSTDVKFNWIAIVPRENPQIPEETYDLQYSDKMLDAAEGKLRVKWNGNQVIYENTGKTLVPTKQELESPQVNSKR